MKRPKNFLLLVLLLSVVAVVLAAAFHATREGPPGSQTPFSAEAGHRSPVPTSVSDAALSNGTPSAAARKRAKDFNDATNRFNAPDDQPR